MTANDSVQHTQYKYTFHFITDSKSPYLLAIKVIARKDSFVVTLTKER